MPAADPTPRGASWIETRPTSALDLARAVALSPRALWRRRDLVRTLVGRDLAARLRGTLLGPLWPLVHPLAMLCAYGFVFAHLFGARLPGASAELGASYGVYLFTGAVVWAAFAESLTRAATAIVDQRQLVQRSAFPAEVLPLEVVLAGATTQLFGVLAFVVVAGLTPLWPAVWGALAWIPLLLLLQAVFTYGLALFLAALHVVRRDTAQLLGVVLTFAMLATPLFWVPSPAVLPGIEPWLPWIEANPLQRLLYAWRVVLMDAQPAAAFGTSPARAVLYFCPWALASWLAGRTVFALLERRFADEV